MQTGHILLNSYLHRIKKSDARHCESCWGRGQLEITETVVHFLFECQTYAAEWYNMDRVLGRHSRDLWGILASLDRVKELLKFVGRMARLKTTLGDAIGDVSHLETEEVWQVMVFIFQESMESMWTSKDKLVRPAGSPNPPLFLLPDSQPADSKHKTLHNSTILCYCKLKMAETLNTMNNLLSSLSDHACPTCCTCRLQLGT